MAHNGKTSLLFDCCLAGLAGLFFAFIACVLLALCATTSWPALQRQFSSPLVFSAVWISLQTSLAVVGLTCVFGFPTAYLLAVKEFKGKAVLDTLLDLPTVLPPLVSGLAVLLLVSRSGWVGSFLERLAIHLIFTKKGIILAQLFVAAPFFIKTVRESIAAIPKNLLAASATLHGSPWFTLRKLILPLCRNGVWVGAMMTWTRALGEFGATAMVAGAIPGKTATMTLMIYLQAMSGEQDEAVALALLLLIFAFVTLLVLKIRFKQRVPV
jgi:molybdate transport system permease protein